MIRFIAVICMVSSFTCKGPSGKADNLATAALPTKANVQGTWKTAESVQPDFNISGDSIYFLDGPNQVYFYQIKEDSLTIHLPNYKFTYKVEVFANDSIRFFTDQFMKTYRKIQ